MTRFSLALLGTLLVLGGLGAYILGVAISVPRAVIGGPAYGLAFDGALFRATGVPILVGIALIAVDLLFLFPARRRPGAVMVDPPASLDLTVVLTAYNDEESVGLAVRDFAAHPRVRRVVVVSNNSADRSAASRSSSAPSRSTRASAAARARARATAPRSGSGSA